MQWKDVQNDIFDMTILCLGDAGENMTLRAVLVVYGGRLGRSASAEEERWGRDDEGDVEAVLTFVDFSVSVVAVVAVAVKKAKLDSEKVQKMPKWKPASVQRRIQSQNLLMYAYLKMEVYLWW